MNTNIWFLFFHFILLSVLALYGLHRIAVIRRYWLSRNQKPERSTSSNTPFVTVQAPLYNEHNVAGRIIDALVLLNWPKDKLDIQILDDSNDATIDVVNSRVSYWKQQGMPVNVIRRKNRKGFKAGALANGLKVAKGEFVAIFDADFLPRKEFLHDTIPYFINPKIGMVQTRWGHLNAEQNTLTRLSATLLDGHFVLEHTARNRAGRFFNFNGTAGVWRRDCIDDAGGWQHDTITEDLDISYRAQLKGWDFVFLKDQITPAEIPEEMEAFKTQQFRWAKGTLQTARKLLPQIWGAPIPFATKIEATIHLTANIGYPLTFLLALSMPFTALFRGLTAMQSALYLDIVAFAVTTVSVGIFYFFAGQQSGSGSVRRVLELPLVLALGIGISINQTKAVFQGIFDDDVTFVRTPKIGDKPQTMYKTHTSKTTTLEAMMASYCGLWSLYLLALGIWQSVPFLLLFAFGYGYVAFCSKQRLRNIKSTPNWFNETAKEQR